MSIHKKKQSNLQIFTRVIIGQILEEVKQKTSNKCELSKGLMSFQMQSLFFKL